MARYYRSSLVLLVRTRFSVLCGGGTFSLICDGEMSWLRHLRHREPIALFTLLLSLFHFAAGLSCILSALATTHPRPPQLRLHPEVYNDRHRTISRCTPPRLATTDSYPSEPALHIQTHEYSHLPVSNWRPYPGCRERAFISHGARQQHRGRRTRREARGLLYNTPSASPFLFGPGGLLRGCFATMSLEEGFRPPVCCFGFAVVQLTPDSRGGVCLRRSRLPSEIVKFRRQPSFVSATGATRKATPLKVSALPTAAAATTAGGPGLTRQERTDGYLMNTSASWFPCASIPLLRIGCPHREMCPPAARRSPEAGMHTEEDAEEVGYSAFENLGADEEEAEDMREEEPPKQSLKGKKENYETAVSNEVLQDMVRLRFLYDEEEDEKVTHRGPPFIIEGPQFNGSTPFASPPWGPMARMVPYNRSLASELPTGDAITVAAPPAKEQNSTERIQDMWKTLTGYAPDWDFYGEPGSRLQEMAGGTLLVTPPINPNRVYLWTKQDVEGGAYEDPYADGTVRHEEPSYLNPRLRALATGRRRDAHRRTDTGKKQKKRWGMDDIQADIPRGNWTYTDDIYKDMVDSIDWEREWPHIHDQNYYKRSHYSTLTGDPDRNEDSYWDPQFIGAVDTSPRVLPAGMNYTWPVYWVPWLCKKHPRRGGQPLKSEPFNMGGVEPLQLWFYPDGCELAHPGFCSVKLVSRPGWNLPYRIKMWIEGSTVDVPVVREASVDSSGAGGLSCPSRSGSRKDMQSAGRKDGGRTERTPGPTSVRDTRRIRSRVEVGPVRREEADYVAYSTSFCRLLDKKSFLRLQDFPFPPFGDPLPSQPLCYNPATDVVLRAAGDVDIGVAVAEENWDWDDGHWSMEQWLKLQSVYPDDLEMEEIFPAGFTDSDMFENYKYRDVPDKHYAKYFPSGLPPALKGENFDQMALNRRHAY